MHSVAEGPVQVAQEASQFMQTSVLESQYWVGVQLSQLIPFGMFFGCILVLFDFLSFNETHASSSTRSQY